MKTLLRKIFIYLLYDGEERDYMIEVLYRDESRKLGSKLGLQGWYDRDIEMNREMQKSLNQNL
jgi:hypothetical protein